MYNNGQFVIHNNDLAIIIAEQKTLIGYVYTIIPNIKTNKSTIQIVSEKELKEYNRKPNNEPAASNMSDKQKKCIKIIEQNLDITFNGKTMSDVSCFISLFINQSKKRRHSRYEYDPYEGLDGFDVFHKW